MRTPAPIPESRIEELKDFRKDKWPGFEFYRFLCVWLRVAQNLGTQEIANILSWHVNTVRYTQNDFIKRGIDALVEVKRGGRRRQTVSLDEEKNFLDTFIAKATKGRVVVIHEIKEAFEKQFGKIVHKTTIYRMLARHGWRKIVPARNHPKRNQEAVEEFKKKLL